MTLSPPPIIPANESSSSGTIPSSSLSTPSPSSNDNQSTNNNENYKCFVEIQFPTTTCAQQALEVLSVDQEIGDRVVKTLSVRDDLLVVNVQSSEAKMLRVSISSFYDMLTVFLKCHQEFGS